MRSHCMTRALLTGSTTLEPLVKEILFRFPHKSEVHLKVRKSDAGMISLQTQKEKKKERKKERKIERKKERKEEKEKKHK